jgi:RNA polymerase sigma factor (sigma-70 family)
MHGSPSPSVTASRAHVERERIRTELQQLLFALDFGDSARPHSSGVDEDARLATCLMDAYRVTRDRDAYEGLVQWSGPHLRARIRTRLRCCGVRLDPQEVWQDTIVNIFRYPDRFEASRPGAFAAWSSTIVDNVIRRQLRDARRGPPVASRDPELLQSYVDEAAVDPGLRAAAREECLAASSAYGVVLQAYLAAFERLSDRERAVLHMVEVEQLRYADVAEVVGGRPEALKMVVFRARKRLFERIQQLLIGADVAPATRGARGAASATADLAVAAGR